MTNKELREILKQYPDDMPITLHTPYNDGFCWHGIEKIEMRTYEDGDKEIIIHSEDS